LFEGYLEVHQAGVDVLFGGEEKSTAAGKFVGINDIFC
jgi:hypothetical protein